MSAPVLGLVIVRIINFNGSAPSEAFENTGASTALLAAIGITGWPVIALSLQRCGDGRAQIVICPTVRVR
ncbi:MAG: hypothetical protein AAFO70_05635, partial [Pseudomonadota bacterium]